MHKQNYINKNNKNVQKKYMCFSFYDLYCIKSSTKKNITFSVCDMDYSTYHNVVSLQEINEHTIKVHTNKFGIMCKQSKIEDRIRWKIFRNYQLRNFIQIFEDVIIYKHLQAIWFSYNRKIITNLINKFCYYFCELPKSILNTNFNILYINQLNIETLKIIIQYTFKIEIFKLKKIKTKQQKYKYSDYTIGDNFVLSKNTIGEKTQNKDTFALQISCNEHTYNKILKNFEQKNEILKYVKNIKLNILVKTKIKLKYNLKQSYLGRNFITKNYQEKEIYTVLI